MPWLPLSPGRPCVSRPSRCADAVAGGRGALSLPEYLAMGSLRPRTAAFLCPLAAIAALLVAPEPAAAQPDRAPAACAAALDGHVVDDGTHEPVAGALVTAGDRVEITDGAGRFAIRGLCPGRLDVRIERDGYAPASQGVTLPAETAPAGAPVQSLEVRLRAAPGEVIVVQGETPEPIDMRSTAVLAGEDLERTRGRALSDTLAEVPGV